MESYYKGTEIKFVIDIQAEGFSMDDDDFDVTVASQRNSVSASKDSPDPDGKLVIFREDDSSSSGDDSSSGGTWYGIVNTETFSQGDLRVITTAHIIDPNAADGVRNDIAVAPLVPLKNP